MVKIHKYEYNYNNPYSYQLSHDYYGSINYNVPLYDVNSIVNEYNFGNDFYKNSNKYRIKGKENS